VLDESVLVDYFGRTHTINNTIKGKMMPAAIIILGVEVQSFKKHKIRPTIANIMIARVPLPIPPTKPSYTDASPEVVVFVVACAAIRLI
jgi:hypothetical protein